MDTQNRKGIQLQGALPTFYPFADKNAIVSSYFIVEIGFFVGIYKKRDWVFWEHNRKKETNFHVP